MAATQIRTTKDYRLFKISDKNRPLNLAKHKVLEESMKTYGFLKSFPVSCFRDNSKNLTVRDGQHRLAVAEKLGLPVHFIEDDIDFDIATVNCASVSWKLRDYADNYAARGLSAYSDLIVFYDNHRIPIGLCVALLSGTTTFNNVRNSFFNGTFKVRERQHADRVANLYCGLVRLKPTIKSARLIEACIAVCRVPDFDSHRLLSIAESCVDKLASCSTRDGALVMLEDIYNYRRKSGLVPLKIKAQEVMRDRNPAKSKKSA